MVDRTAEGHKAKPYTLLIEHGKVAEFIEAIGADPEDYNFNGEIIVPATYLTTSFFWERRVEGANPLEAVKQDPSKALHAEQEYTFFGPPPVAGTKLTCQGRVDRMWEKTSKSGKTLLFVDIVTDYHDETGALVAEGKMTIVEPQ